MSCALDDEVAEIGCVSTHKEAAFEPRNLAAADENRNAEQRYAQHDRYIDADEMAADIDTIGRNKAGRSEEHTSDLQSLMRTSSAVFSLKKKKKEKHQTELQTTK